MQDFLTDYWVAEIDFLNGKSLTVSYTNRTFEHGMVVLELTTGERLYINLASVQTIETFKGETDV